MAVEVGHAYLTVMPTLKGAAASISAQLSKVSLDSVGAKLGDQLADGIDGAEAAAEARRAGKRAGDAYEDGLEDGLDGAEGVFSSKMAAVSGAVGGLVSSLAQSALDSVAALGGEMVAASDSANKFANTLSFAGMDTASIDRLTASTQAYADATVYDLGDIRNVTAQLASNGVKDFDRLAEAAGNLNAVAGGNADTFSSVGMVMTQTAGAGKLTTENWNQMADAIPGASGALQDAMRAAGAFEGNFRDAMANGEVSADEFFAAVQKLGMEDVAREAATSTETFEGALGNLQASIVGVGSQVLDEVKPLATDAMSVVADAVSGIPEKLEALAPVAELAGDAVAFLSEHMNVILPVLGAVAGGFVAFKAAIAITGAITAVQTALAAMPSVLALVKTGVQLLNAAFRANPFAVVATVIGVVVGALVTLWSTNEGFRNAVVGVWNAVKGTVKASIESVKGAISGARGVIDSLGARFRAVKSTIASAINGAKSAVTSAIAKIKSAFNVRLKFPDIKMPHFNIYGGKMPWGLGGAGSPPKIDIEWYARGGIVDGASLIGVGEAGPEAVVPLTAPALLPFAQAVASQIDGGAGSSTVYNMTVNGLAFNDNDAIREAFIALLREFMRKGAM